MPPAVAGSGESVFVTETSAPVATVVVAVAELFAGTGSGVVEAAVAVLPITVPAGVAAFTFTTRVNTSAAPIGTLALVQLIEPVPPTAGVRQPLHPAGADRDTNVVFAGVESERVVSTAASGPAFETVIE